MRCVPVPYLAIRHAQPAWSLSPDIAEGEDIPRKFLEAILVELRDHGIVESRRGRYGGYPVGPGTGAHRGEGEVIRIVDGPLALAPCASRTQVRAVRRLPGYRAMRAAADAARRPRRRGAGAGMQYHAGAAGEEQGDEAAAGPGAMRRRVRLKHVRFKLKSPPLSLRAQRSNPGPLLARGPGSRRLRLAMTSCLFGSSTSI